MSMNYDLPDYIDPDLFAQWIDWRKDSTRKKLTAKSLERIIKLGITKLETLHNQGHDVNQCIEETLFNEWKGFFPPKVQYGTQQRSDSQALSRTDQKRADAMRKFLNKSSGMGGDVERAGGSGGNVVRS